MCLKPRQLLGPSDLLCSLALVLRILCQGSGRIGDRFGSKLHKSLFGCYCHAFVSFGVRPGHQGH